MWFSLPYSLFPTPWLSAMKAKWWTCVCGKAQVYRGYGTPTCEDCGKLATFTVAPPKGQGGLFEEQGVGDRE
jgi:hypothetical protein